MSIAPKLFTIFSVWPQRIILGPVLLLSLSLLASPASAAPLEINWEDLLPSTTETLTEKSRELQKEFRELDKEKQTLYRSIADELALRERLDSGIREKGDLGRQELDSLEANLSGKNPEAVAFWDQVSKLNEEIQTEREKINPELNGKSIKMPGYVLPLQSEDGKVYEFMLVPYVGACVHTPAPPANQLVFVKTSEGFPSEDLFTPVWVEGVMSTKQATYDLSYRDGNLDVESGYSLDAVQIKVYEEEN